MRFMMVLAALTAIAGPLPSQEARPAAPKPPTPLFASHDSLAITLTADFKAIFKDRDTTEQNWQPATLAWRAGRDSGQLAVELTTRGHFRLKTGTCSFPPLRVRFPKDARAGTLFDKQGNIKLATHCRSGSERYEQIVHQEFLVYRAYNTLTDSSFRVRFARATYVDTAAGTRVDAPSFFIEDGDDLADRIAMEPFEHPGVRFSDVDQPTLALMGVFLYMIGNTDWSLPYLHNIRVFAREGHYITVPYDFDWSGVVDAPYARPDARLGIRSVRQRVWRGSCHDRDLLRATLDRFVAARDAITALYRGQSGLQPRWRDDMLEYYADFYKLAADERGWTREMLGNCRR